MKKKYGKLVYTLAITIVLYSSYDTKAQSPVRRKHIDWFTGMGVGLDYGGLGLKLEYLPAAWLGVSLGGGYNLAGLGVNGGLSYKITPEKEVTPIVTAVYGYNGVIINKYTRNGNRIVEKKIYYGTTIGAGVDCAIGSIKQNKITMLLLFPFRNKEFHEDADGNKHVIPVTMSLGFNWGY